jgi:hypothetical protein
MNSGAWAIQPPRNPEFVGAFYWAEGLAAGEGVFALAAQAEVDVAAGAGLAVGELGHEGDGDAGLIGDLLEALLEEDVIVGHLEDGVVADVDLVLAEAPFALGVFDDDAGGFEVAADGGGVELFAGALKNVVVLQIPAQGLAIALFGGIAEGLAEGVVFELGGGHGVETEGCGAGDLALEDGARGDGHVVEIAVDEGGFVLPAQAAGGAHFGDEEEVAVAELPVGELVAGDGLHFGVGGEQVVAGVGAVGGDFVEEVLGVEALAHEAAVVIGEGGDDGIDGSFANQFFQVRRARWRRPHQVVPPHAGGVGANSRPASQR